jgi:flagellar biosynthesis chaperone FliJ
MALTPRQQHEVREAVRLLWNELNQCVKRLDRLEDLRNNYGTDVVTALAKLITPAEWQATQDFIKTRRDTLWARIEVARGAGLDDLLP